MSSRAQALAPFLSQGWVIPVKEKVPPSPKTLASQTSLWRSVSGLSPKRRMCLRKPLARVLSARVRPSR